MHRMLGIAAAADACCLGLYREAAHAGCNLTAGVREKAATGGVVVPILAHRLSN